MKLLIENLAKLQDEAKELLESKTATPEEMDAKTAEIKALKAEIDLKKEIEAKEKEKEIVKDLAEEKDMTPVNAPVITEPKPNSKPFKSFAEQLVAIVNSSRQGASVDNRLIQIQNATGASEGVPSEGGFLVQQDFSSEILKTVYETGTLVSRCRKIPISGNSNGLKINGVDETSRADGSRWGGVQAYWAEEAGTVTATKPKFRKIELELKKVMALYYATSELLQDASAMEGVLSQAFSEEIGFKLDDAIFRGDGSGKPLGVLNAGCLVTQAKETGQANDTVVFENILNMWSRLLAKYRSNAVWYINQEVEPQLYSMVLSAGTAGVPVYMPAGGISGQPYGTLFGRPVVPIEHASAIGDVGDIVLADMSQYLLIDKGGMQTASSMHLKFDYDEMVFRVTYRVDGQPMLASAITPYKGTASRTLSPFVTLAAR